MIAIITGDIINSRRITNQKVWIAPLKKVLRSYGQSPATWEIFRGDSFQVEIAEPAASLLAAIRIKAAIRSIKGLDVRMAIGIGNKTYIATGISESNGEAFVNSGEKFEELKKIKQRLAVKSPWPQTDRTVNLMITLASMAMDNWTVNSAEIVTLSLRYAELPQKQLGKKLKISQSSVSERQTRANYAEIMALETYYRDTITAHFA
ncbi:MAG: transcriptional regulator [Chitinophagaceae bacterium]|nr:MAG: transcriptional regulator [Chitinophagaceae bacterium]